MSDAEPGLLPGRRPLRPGHGSGPLAGFTVAVKDLFDVAGEVTGAGNPVYAAGARPAGADAEAVSRLTRAGAILWAKSITDEFAYSLEGDNVHFGAPDNLRAPGRLTGGSSSGSAAAVAAGLVDIGLGSDTAGSIRVPASYCALYGYRPTHGVIPTTGVVPVAPSFDTVGLLAADLDRLAAAAAALGALAAPPEPVRRFVVPTFLLGVADAEVRAVFQAGLDRLVQHGAEVGEWDGDGEIDADRLAAAYLVLSRYEVWASHGAWVEAHWRALGDDVADRFRAASMVDPDGDEAREARSYRERLRVLLSGALEPGDVLILPAAANPPLAVDADAEVRAHSRTATIGLCAVAGLTGAAAVVVPGAPSDRLPVGICVVAPPGGDATALAAARVLDDALRGGADARGLSTALEC